jgi:hypothetical protein
MRNPSDHFLQTINADFHVVRTTLKGLQAEVGYQSSLLTGSILPVCHDIYIFRASFEFVDL